MPIETRSAVANPPAKAPVLPDDAARRARIAIAAYYRAERRGFAPGREIEDWLEAERDLETGSAAAAVRGPDPGVRAAREPAVPASVGAKAKARTSRGGPRRTTQR